MINHSGTNVIPRTNICSKTKLTITRKTLIDSKENGRTGQLTQIS